MKYAAIVCAIISFLVVFLVTPKIIRYMRKIGLVVDDMNKEDKPSVPVAGGLAVMGGVFFGLMTYVFMRTFLYNDSSSLLFLFAATTCILVISLVGFIDDLLVRKLDGKYVGFKQWQKPLLTLVAAVPLMVVNAGTTAVNFPFFGTVDFGLVYPLILIPLGVVGAANMVNLLAGFNGLETGLGIISIGMLGLYSYFNGTPIATVIALVTFASLVAFYFYTKYPSKIFPGDSLTYLIGAAIVCIAVLGNMEKAAIIVSIPFFIEFVLKIRSKLKADSYGYFLNGKIKSKYKKIYSIPHIFTRSGRFTEKQVVYFIFLIELFFASLIWFV